MRICTRCKKEKELNDFYFKLKAQGIRHVYCKDCSQFYVKLHYIKHREYYLLKARKRNRKLRAEIRDYILNYFKGHPCVDCGEKDPVVLEFDHIVGFTKLSEICTLSRNYRFEEIKEEIKKCQVRCANCHRRKTARDGHWNKNIAPVA